jgi:hypothetical protein
VTSNYNRVVTILPTRIVLLLNLIAAAIVTNMVRLMLFATYTKRLQYSKCSECWKDSYNPVVVAGHVDRLEGLLFRPALLKGFSPDCRTVTLVNTSTVTIILCYCIILLIKSLELSPVFGADPLFIWQYIVYTLDIAIVSYTSVHIEHFDKIYFGRAIKNLEILLLSWLRDSVISIVTA